MFSFYYFGMSVLILHLITDVIYVTCMCTLFVILSCRGGGGGGGDE